MTLVKRVWLPVLVVFAIGMGMVAVSNLRSVFGSDGAIVTPIDADTAENFNPKIVKYEIFGTGSYASINYADLDGKPQRTGEVPGNDLAVGHAEHHGPGRRFIHHLPRHR
jgi:hypothetical protein